MPTHSPTQASLLVGPSVATPLLANHVPWHAARHTLLKRQGHATTLKWMVALAAMLALALARAADPLLGGSVWAVGLVGYAVPVVVMCCAVWGTVVDGMALQEQLAREVSREANADSGVPPPPKTSSQQRRQRVETPDLRVLRQVVARCEDAERRAQHAACVAMVMLVLLRVQR